MCEAPTSGDAFDAATTVTENSEQPRGGQQHGDINGTDFVGRAALAWYTIVACWRRGSRVYLALHCVISYQSTG